jgi:hypothetical protein
MESEERVACEQVGDGPAEEAAGCQGDSQEPRAPGDCSLGPIER